MNFAVNENGTEGKGLPTGLNSALPGGEGGARLEISWHVSPEQSVAIADLTGKGDGLSLLAATAVPAHPLECCYL